MKAVKTEQELSEDQTRAHCGEEAGRSLQRS